ncbi:MAG: hypothetical protein WDO18_11275 [Acidobacteriota bacterium]
MRAGRCVASIEPEAKPQVPLAERSKFGAKLAAKKFVKDTDLESLVAITARGRSARQLQTELLAAHARGEHDILCRTGDGFGTLDIDGAGLVYLARQLNCGLDMGGNSWTRWCSISKMSVRASTPTAAPCFTGSRKPPRRASRFMCSTGRIQ